MATMRTLTGTIANLIHETPQPNTVRVVIDNNLNGGALIDSANQTVMVGGVGFKLEDGAFSVQLPDTAATDLNVEPNTLRYTVRISYVNGDRERKEVSLGPFELTANRDLSDPALDLDLPVITPEWRSAYKTEVEALGAAKVAQAEAARTAAETARAFVEARVVDDMGTTDGQTKALITTPSSQTATALAATFGRGQSVAAYGAKGDGTTDDTAAIQAAIDATPAGGSIYFPETGSGAYYKISDTLTITKPNIRFQGQPRDAYAMSIRCAVAGKTMIEVKAPGFVMQDVALWGDVTAANGAGATVTGLDLYGDTDGNVDALITGATFQGLATCVRVRGRNSTVERSMFSNALEGVVIDGKNGTYHTGPAADQNRGNVVRSSRFHNIGTSATHGAIRITTTAKVLHAIIESNFFDSSGEARHIVAEGTSANPHAKLTILNNKHTELRAHAVELVYVNNSAVRGAYLAGDTTVDRDAHGFAFSNCHTVTLSDSTGLQLGTSGVYARSCTFLRVRGVEFRAIGRCATTTGHGFDIDSTNTFAELDGIAVEGTDGYGFKGSPVSSRLGVRDFYSCTAGQIDSTVFGRESITVPAFAFTSMTGTPNLTGVPGVGYPPSWQLDPATAEQVATFVPRLPDTWRTFDVVAVWAPANNAGGDVVLTGNLSYPVAGGLPSAGGISLSTVTTAAPTVAGQITETTLATGLVRNSAALSLRITRAAANAADTYAADVALIGVRLVRAS